MTATVTNTKHTALAFLVAVGALTSGVCSCNEGQKAVDALPTAPTPAPPSTGPLVAKPAPYRAGDVLLYMPSECPKLRLFGKFAALLKEDAISSEFDILVGLLVGGAEPQSRAKSIFKVLSDGGFEPTETVVEVAMCINDKVGAVAVGLAHDHILDPLKLVARSVEAGSGQAPKIESEGHVRWFRSRPGKNERVIGVVAPRVMVLARDKDALLALAKGRGGLGFSGAGKHVLWVTANSGSNDSFALRVRDAPENLEAWVGFQVTGRELARMKMNPGVYVKQQELVVARYGQELDGTPFGVLAEHLKTAKIAVSGDRLVVTSSVPKTDLVETLKLVNAKPGRLKEIFK